MPLVFNGTTIPDNVANAFSFNGANITDVYFNGVQVWHQSLFPAVGWSGNSYSTYNAVSCGLETSGTSIRFKDNYDSTVGAWITVTSSGFPSSTSTTALYGAQGYFGIGCGSNFLYSMCEFYSNVYTGLVYFSVGVGFTGSSVYAQPTPDIALLETTSGLLRYYYSYGKGTAGAWISLT